MGGWNSTALESVIAVFNCSNTSNACRPFPPVIIDDGVSSGDLRHGGTTRVADISREVLLKVIADGHGGDSVKSSQWACLCRMAFLKTVGTDSLGAEGASMPRLPAIVAKRIFVRGRCS